MSDLANTNLRRVSTTGGAVTVTLSTGSGQGNDGTSLLCKQVWIMAARGNSDRVWVNIGVAASVDTLGIVIPQTGSSSYVYNALNIPIDDVSKLYFASDDANAIVHILYTA